MKTCELPNDIETLKHLVLETHQTVVDREERLAAQREEIEERDARIAQYEEYISDRDARITQHEEHISERDATIKKLQSQLAFLKHKLFGRRGEKLDPAQLLLFKELTDQVEALQEEAELEQISYKRRKPHGRKPLPDDLPSEDIVYPPEHTDCPCCGEAMRNIGDEVTEELEYHPGSLFKRRHIRPKYACHQCQEGVHIAPMPPRPIDKGIAGPGLLAHVLTSKYADHTPLNRLQGMLNRHGVDISVATMCDWVGRMADLLAPIREGLKAQLLAGPLIQSDDTETPYLLRSDKKQTARGYLWTYLCESSRLVLYDFRTSRGRAGPTDFLRGFSGTLLTDGYAGYDEIVRTAGLIRAGCWAHARRKYYDARRDDPRRCGQMLRLIQDLFGVDRKAKEAREQSIDSRSPFGEAEHLALRQAESAPLIEKIRDCVDAWSLEVLPRSSVGQAIAYMSHQWKPLTVFLADASVALDNNASERAMRHVVIGRKNWMFAGSESGGHRAATIYSIVATCKLNGLDPFAYLRDVIDRLPRGEDPALLLPAAWKADQLTRPAASL